MTGNQLKDLAKLLQENVCQRVDSLEKESVEMKKNMVEMQRHSMTKGCLQTELDHKFAVADKQYAKMTADLQQNLQ